MKHLATSVAHWYLTLSWQWALLDALLFFFAIAGLFACLFSYFDERKVEMRRIQKRRRRELAIRISAQELAKHREDIDVRVSRGFMAAFKETHR